MTQIAFWTLSSIMVVISNYFIISKKIRYVDIVSAFTLWCGSGVVDKVLSTQFKLYYYIDLSYTPLYSSVYDLTVYPAFAILYSRWFPSNRTMKSFILYNLAWTIFMTLLELTYIYPTGVIVYINWDIIPNSLFFYLIGFPFYCYYYLLSEKWLKKHVC